MIFVSCTTSHVGLRSFLESIEHDFKGLNDSHRQPNSDLAQLVEHQSDDQKVMSPNPTGGSF